MAVFCARNILLSLTVNSSRARTEVNVMLLCITVPAVSDFFRQLGGLANHDKLVMQLCFLGSTAE